MPTLVTAVFTLPLGADAALLLRTPAIAEAYHEVLVANQERLARWERWAAEKPTLESTRAFVEAGARGWLAGEQLPAAIAVPVEGGWRLVGSAGLRINAYTETGDVGYWIDAAHEGRGLVSRALSALLDHAFEDLGLHRVSLRTDVTNVRSRAVAERLGFTREGVERQAITIGDQRRDDVLYGLLADEWRTRLRPTPRPGT